MATSSIASRSASSSPGAAPPRAPSGADAELSSPARRARRRAAVRVGEELHLDVPWPLEVALAVERSVGERAGGLSLRGGERLVELRGRADDAHPASATACGCLDEEREPDLLRRAVGQHQHPCVPGDPLRLELVAAEPTPPVRADPGQAGGLDRRGEVGVLGEEPIARMDGIRARSLAARSAPPRRGSPPPRRSFRRTGVERPRSSAAATARLDSERAARAEHAKGDLPSVRDESSAIRTADSTQATL